MNILTAPAPSLVVTPAVVGHRGASGQRPEHTLDAYRLAIAQGADNIELDLVPTADGVLVARHEPEIGATTDVAEHPEFAARRCTKEVYGESITGWFAEDFTLAELKTLGARERLPQTRPGNVTHNGGGVPTLNEVLAMVQAESTRRRRTIGVMCELKHPAYFESIGLGVAEPLLADLARYGVDHPRSRVSVMCFEVTILRKLAERTRVPLVQLLDRPELELPDLPGQVRFADLATREGLAMIDEYADSVGVHKELVLPTGESGALLGPTRLVREAHRRWLEVYVWTLRAENRYLPADFRRGSDPDVPGDLAAEAAAFLDLGVDGLITDFPGLVVPVRDRR